MKDEKVIITLMKIVFVHNGLNKLFNKYDKQKRGYLNLDEFTEMLKIIDKQLTDEDIVLYFYLFDTKNLKQIDKHLFEQRLKLFESENKELVYPNLEQNAVQSDESPSYSF